MLEANIALSAELGVLALRHSELCIATNNMMNDIEDLRTRLNHSNIEDTLRSLEGTCDNARHIIPKISELLRMIEGIAGDIEDL
jgi:hypothetical protein